MTIDMHNQADGYLILVNLSAAWNLTYRRPMRVARGELMVVESKLGANCKPSDTAGLVEIRIASHFVRQWLPDPGAIVGKIIGTQSPWSCALASYVVTVAQLTSGTGRPASQFLPEHLGALLALAADEMRAPSRKSKACETDKFAEIKKVVEARCTDHDLNASAVAQHCCVSSRTLHRVLARNGASYAELVTRSRIERAQAMLHARHLRHLTTAEIGYRAGFRDPSIFARAFRQRVGLRPVDVRC